MKSKQGSAITLDKQMDGETYALSRTRFSMKHIPKKRLLIVAGIIGVLVTASIGTFTFITQYEVAIPFERTQIYSVEINDDDREIVIHFVDNIESYATRTRINYDDATMDIHIHLRDTYHTRYFSNRARVTNSIYIPFFEEYSIDIFPNHEELNVIAETDDEFPVSGEFVRVETVRVYYSTWPMRQFVPWAWGGLGEEHLIWEKMLVG